MIKEAIYHINMDDFIYPIARNKLVVRIRTACRDIKKCNIIFWDRTKPKEKKEEILFCQQRDSLFDYFEGNIIFSKVARYHKYCFYLEDHEGNAVYYTANGITETLLEDGHFEYLYANEKDVLTIPEWAKGTIYYQIFPERFCNGEIKNDPQNCEPWGSKPTRDNYMGGDLSGIRKKLPYLNKLGIKCIYLTPIFEGDFNHKYATTNYFKIDSSFGDEREFRSLVEECHAADIKILLDGVFNHTGVHFKAFEDILEQQEQSGYKEWYYIQKFPITISHYDYECVGAYKWMPKLNTSNSEVRKFILSVMEYWISEYGVDGWRLDVADEVDKTVWQEANAVLKSKYPDVLLVGETWGYGGKLLQANQMDIVMNYMFRDAVRDYFGTEIITAFEFDKRLNHMLALYKKEVNLSLYNLLDSHDTERFLYYCSEDKRRLKLAIGFQFLFPGSPAIYYGDEVGMTGNNDPDCRKAMLWDEKVDTEILGWYQKLSSIRNELQVIRTGNYKTILVDEEKQVFGFVRYNKTEEVYILIHKEEGEKIVICPLLKNGKWKDVISGTEMVGEVKKKGERFFNEDILEYEATLEIKLEAYSIRVITKQEDIV